MTTFNKLMKQAIKAMQLYDREITRQLEDRDDDDSVKGIMSDEKIKNNEAMLEIKALMGSDT
jgi:hypothetical protein